jgi:hypothetical protein
MDDQAADDRDGHGGADEDRESISEDAAVKATCLP